MCALQAAQHPSLLLWLATLQAQQLRQRQRAKKMFLVNAGSAAPIWKTGVFRMHAQQLMVIRPIALRSKLG